MCPLLCTSEALQFNSKCGPSCSGDAANVGCACRPMKNTISGNEARGFMKILVDAKTDTVIGVHMIGPDCAEIMQASLLH